MKHSLFLCLITSSAFGMGYDQPYTNPQQPPADYQNFCQETTGLEALRLSIISDLGKRPLAESLDARLLKKLKNYLKTTTIIQKDPPGTPDRAARIERAERIAPGYKNFIGDYESWDEREQKKEKISAKEEEIEKEIFRYNNGVISDIKDVIEKKQFSFSKFAISCILLATLWQSSKVHSINTVKTPQLIPLGILFVALCYSIPATIKNIYTAISSRSYVNSLKKRLEQHHDLKNLFWRRRGYE